MPDDDIVLKKEAEKRMVWKVGIVVIVVIIAIIVAFIMRRTVPKPAAIMSNLSCLKVRTTFPNNPIEFAEEEVLSNEDGMQLKPYTFTVTNSCNVWIASDVTIEIFDEANVEHKDIRASLHHAGHEIENSKLLRADIRNTESLIKNAISYTLMSLNIGPDESKTFDLRLWIDEKSKFNFSEEAKFIASVVFIIDTEDIEPTLVDEILFAGFGTDNIREFHRSFRTAWTNRLQQGIYRTQDDYGASYYFRGGHDLNNNVLFGGFQWKIVRIDGQGNIRLIYNGTEEEFNALNTVNTDENTMLEDSVFNLQRDNNSFVSFDVSAINIILAKWLIEELYDDDDFVVTTTYCNDRSFIFGTGVGTADTNYSSMERQTEGLPSLKCERTQDRIQSNIGLLTMDEVMFAGSEGYQHESQFFLNNGAAWWTMTPASFVTGHAHIWNVDEEGKINPIRVNREVGIRPVITIKGNIPFITGDGSKEDPYVIN